MQFFLVALVVAGLLPLALTLRANHGTSLTHALWWAIAAWQSWGVAFVLGDPASLGMDALRYVALCLTGCAGIAVLGARRPHVAAWNFVLLGLLAVMLLPLMETLFIGTHPVDGLRISFLSGTIAVGALNYLPTRFAPACLVLLAGSATEIALVFAPAWFPGAGEAMWLHVALLATPWIAWACAWRQRDPASAFDLLWLRFRDRWGLFWAQRVREQFNQSARNAGWPVVLRWRGLTTLGDHVPTEAEMIATLRAVLQRFLDGPASG